MKMWMVIAGLLVLPLVAAQETGKTEEPPVSGGVTKVFQLKYAQVSDVRSALAAFEVELAHDSNLQILSARGSEEAVEAIAEAIKEIDVPAAATRNVELTFHILLAERGAETSTNSPLPDDLESVAIQLKKVLGFSGVRLLESAVIRVRDSSAVSVTGVIGVVGAAPAGYRLRFRGANVIGQADSTAVRLQLLEFSTRVQREAGGNFMDVGLETDVDVKTGQKAVVGNAGVDEQGRTLILVVAARVV